MFLLTREFLILSHLYREPWKKGGVTVVCNTEKNPMLSVCSLESFLMHHTSAQICTDLKGMELDSTMFCYSLVLVSGQRDLSSFFKRKDRRCHEFITKESENAFVIVFMIR